MRAHFFYRQEKIFGICTCLAVATAVDSIPFVLFLFSFSFISFIAFLVCQNLKNSVQSEAAEIQVLF